MKNQKIKSALLNNVKNYTLTTLAVISLQFTITSCEKEEVKPKTSNPIINQPDSSKWQTDILPIMQTKCIQCHKKPYPSYLLYSAVKTEVDNGNFKKYVVDEKTMPQGMTLTETEFNKITLWLNQGALNN